MSQHRLRGGRLLLLFLLCGAVALQDRTDRSEILAPPPASSSALPQLSAAAPPARTAILFQQRTPREDNSLVPRRPDVTVDE